MFCFGAVAVDVTRANSGPLHQLEESHFDGNADFDSARHGDKFAKQTDNLLNAAGSNESGDAASNVSRWCKLFMESRDFSHCFSEEQIDID